MCMRGEFRKFILNFFLIVRGKLLNHDPGDGAAEKFVMSQVSMQTSDFK